MRFLAALLLTTLNPESGDFGCTPTFIAFAPNGEACCAAAGLAAPKLPMPAPLAAPHLLAATLPVRPCTSSLRLDTKSCANRRPSSVELLAYTVSAMISITSALGSSGNCRSMSIKSSVLIVRPCRLSLQYRMNSGDGALGSNAARFVALASAEGAAATRLEGDGDAGADGLPTTFQALPEPEVGIAPLVLREAVPKAGRAAKGDAAAEP